MSGTVPSLSMSTRFDNATGKPLIGGLLYFYQANTTTPQNAYKDTNLTQVHPNPIALDGAGCVPEFYLADGNIHVRLTNSSGVLQLDAQNTLVIGPSGTNTITGSVDPTALFQTGDPLFSPVSGARTGWVRQNALTIGNASSGATERANSDTSALFSYLWTKFAQPSSNVKCPVIGGASAAADFAANKQITLPDMRGRVPVGLDDMGNSAAGRILSSNVTSSGDGPTTPLGSGGEANHTLNTSEIPSHNHALTDPGHTNPLPDSGSIVSSGTPTSKAYANFGSYTQGNVSGSAQTGITLANTGGGQAHNTMPPFVLGTWYLKL
jgi:microcystin-dependent protein